MSCRPPLGPWGRCPASETGLPPTCASGGGGTQSRGWSRATRPVRLARDENRGPATLVDAVFARPRTWVRFPPSPSRQLDPRVSRSTGSSWVFVVEARNRLKEAPRRARSSRPQRNRSASPTQRAGATCGPCRRSFSWLCRRTEPQSHLAQTGILSSIAEGRRGRRHSASGSGGAPRSWRSSCHSRHRSSTTASSSTPKAMAALTR